MDAALTGARPPFAAALATGPVILDGGLGTLLEARGNDVSSDLWSARILLEDPDEVRAAHAEFFAAGAQVAITASYQVSYEGLARSAATPPRPTPCCAAACGSPPRPR